MKKIYLGKFAKYLESLYEGLQVTSIKKSESYSDAYEIYFSYEGELRLRILNSLEDQVETSLGEYLYDISVELDSEARVKNENSSLSYGIISLGFNDKKVKIFEAEGFEDKNESIFAKKFNHFISHLWKNNIEKMIVKKIYKYKRLIVKDPAKGKEYLNDLYLNNKDLIDSNASLEFKDELSKLINDYKGEEQLNELQDGTKYFNKKTKKLYSDANYFGESINNNKMNNKNLELIKRIDNFFYIAENESALNNWEDYKKSILKESNIKTWEEYAEVSSLNEEIKTATGLFRLHNLMPRAELFLQKENYLYRPTKDYCYKVGLIFNPYADKEGNIFFDDENVAKQYADSSRGKYEYIGKENINESVQLNEDNDTEYVNVRISSTRGKISKLIGSKIIEELRDGFDIEKGQIKIKPVESVILVSKLPLADLVPLNKSMQAINPALDTKMIGFYSGDKYFNAEKGEYADLHEDESLKDKKFDKVMGEFGDGKLKTGSGKKVTNQKQAIAIAYSESGKDKMNECDCNDDVAKEAENAHIEPYEDWKELKDTEVLNEETTTADIAIPALPVMSVVKRIDEATFETSYKNEINDLVSDGSFEKKLLNFDPYKNASNVVKGSKTEIKKKFDCLFEKYSIKDHNLKEKKIDKFSVLIENDYKESKIVSFGKKDFAKYIFENKNVKNYIKEGKFDYFRYMNNQTHGSTHSLIREYFEAKLSK